MLMKQLLFLVLTVLSVPVSCEHVDHAGEINDPEARIIPLEDVAKLLSALPIETDQMTKSMTPYLHLTAMDTMKNI